MSKNKKFPKMFGIVAILVLCACALGGIALSDSDNSDAGSYGTSSSPLSSFTGTALGCYANNSIYIYNGSSFSLTGLADNDYYYEPTGVTSGFGLTYSSGSDTVSGTLSKTGTITISCLETALDDSESNSYSVTVYVYTAEANLDFTSPDAVDCVSGSSVSYTPVVNLTGSTFTKTSGASWLTLSSGVLSGTAPTVSSMTAYTAVIKATSPGGQNVSQNVTFNVYPVMQLTASSLSLSGTVDSPSSSITITSNVSLNSISVTVPTSGFSVTKSTSTTATFSGTPTVTGTFSFKFTAISSAGPSQTAYITISLTVTEKTLNITSYYPTGIFVEGTTYTYTATANQEVTWSVLSDDGDCEPVITGTSTVSVYIHDLSPGQTTLVVYLFANTSGGQAIAQEIIINVEEVLEFTSVPTASCVVIPVYSYNDDGSYFTAIIDCMISSVDASDDSPKTATFMFVFVGENAEVVTWDFGDGATAEGFNVTHTYADSGTYTYTCTATNDLGSDSVTGDVTAYVDKTTDYLLYALIGIIVLLILFVAIRSRKHSGFKH